MLIIHGDNQILSRRQFLDLKSQAEKSGKQIIELSGPVIALSDLVNPLSTSSLFGQSSALFIENLFSRRPGREKDEITQYLLQNTSADITLWESKDVSAQLKDFHSNSIRLFPLPKYIFEFLDTLSLSSFKKSVSVAPVEQVFASLVTRIHKHILAEPDTKYAGYISDLLQIDYAQKNSRSPYNLETALELWLLNL